MLCFDESFIISQGSHSVKKVWKNIDFQNRLSRPWKSTEFGQNARTVKQKYGNFKLSLSLIWILHFPPMTILQIFFALCSTYKILRKWRWAMAIKFLHLVLKKYKIVFENVWEPWFQVFDISCFCFFSCKSHYFASFSGKDTIHWQRPGVTISRNVWSKNLFFGPEKAQKPCRQASTKPIAGLLSQNSNFRLWVPQKASIVIGSWNGCNMQKFLAPAPEWFGWKNTENQYNNCTAPKFQALAPVSGPLPKIIWLHHQKCLGSRSTALPTSSLLVAI